MQEKIPLKRPVPNATRDHVHELPTKDEEPCEEPCDESLEECIEIVGEPLGKEDYEVCEKEREKSVKRRCRLCWWALLILLAYLLSEYYFKKIFTVY